MSSEQTPLVSTIVTSFNSASTIGQCLRSIAQQDYSKEKIETILVDNYSSDGTVAIARHFTNKIFLADPERSVQRNFGIQKAQGKYILYLDSDMSLSNNLISECVAKCENEKLVALYIPEKIDGPGFWPKVRDFERSFYNGTCIDCVRFIRRDKCLESGGFDETLTGPEDWDFDRRVRKCGKTGIIAASLRHDEGAFSLKRYLQKKRYYIKTLENYINKWGREDKVIRKQLGFWYRYFGVFIENGKWKRLLSHSLLTLGLYFLRLLVGIQYLFRQH